MIRSCGVSVSGVLLRQRVREIRVEQEVLPADLHQKAALSEPPDVHAGLLGRRVDLGDQLQPRDAGLDPVDRFLVVEAVVRNRFGVSASGTGSASAARRLKAESRPRRVVGPEGKSESGSLAIRGLRRQGSRWLRSRLVDRSNAVGRPTGAETAQRPVTLATTEAASAIESRSVLTTRSYCVGASVFVP